MRKVFPISVAVGLVVFAAAQNASTLYSPSRSVQDQGISLVGWGSGTIVETDEAAYEGTSSVRVATRNFFQGGQMRYATPINLAGAFQDTNNLLMFVVKVPDASTTMSGGAGTPASGPDGGREGGLAGGPSSAATTAPPAAPKFDTLRVILSTTDGKRSEAYLPLSGLTQNAQGWMKVGLPLRSIKGFAATNQAVNQIAVSGNSPAAVYIGEVRILNDSTPIYGEILVSDMNIGSGTSVTLTASGQAGATVLKYTWSVVGADGKPFNFEGQSIVRSFRKPGAFKVYCTISDVYGLKKAFTTNIVTITVN